MGSPAPVLLGLGKVHRPHEPGAQLGRARPGLLGCHGKSHPATALELSLRGQAGSVTGRVETPRGGRGLHPGIPSDLASGCVRASPSRRPEEAGLKGVSRVSAQWESTDRGSQAPRL